MHISELNTLGRSIVAAMLTLLICAATAQAQPPAPTLADEAQPPSQTRGVALSPEPPSTRTVITGAVHGETPAGSFSGVYGENTSTTGATANGVRGSAMSTDGGASTQSGVSGVLGVVVPTAPGGFSAGVRGVNNSTLSLGVGVIGYQGGSGWGVYGETPAGFGVYGLTTNTSGVSTGVRGETMASSGTGVTARYSGSGVGTAIDVSNGAIKVSGTNKAAFQHTAAAANITANWTTIDNPMTNGDPNAILIVTPVALPPNVTYVGFPIGVWYNTGTSRWTIFNQVGNTIPVTAVFNVLVIKQ